MITVYSVITSVVMMVGITMMAVTVEKNTVVIVMQRAIVSDLRMLMRVEFVPFHLVLKSLNLKNSTISFT